MGFKVMKTEMSRMMIYLVSSSYKFSSLIFTLDPVKNYVRSLLSLKHFKVYSFRKYIIIVVNPLMKLLRHEFCEENY